MMPELDFMEVKGLDNDKRKKKAQLSIAGLLALVAIYTGMFAWSAISGSGWWGVWFIASAVAMACLIWAARIYDARWNRGENGKRRR